MPRPTAAQLAYGTMVVVATTVVLLAASSAQGTLAVTLLVVLGLLVGTIATALVISAPARRREREGLGRTRVVAQGATPPAPVAPSRPVQEPVSR